MATRKEILEQARGQKDDHKVLLETFRGDPRDVTPGVPPVRPLASDVPRVMAGDVTLPGPLPTLTADGVVASIGPQLPSSSLHLPNPVALAQPVVPAAPVPGVEQMRQAAKTFDRWRVTRYHIGVRVMLQSKARLRRITKRLGVRTMGAALDYLLADAEQRLFGVVRDDG
jgi:hypothetical protein